LNTCPVYSVTDTAFEAIVGFDSYRALKANAEAHPTSEEARRILIAKWFYSHGFLNQDFPPISRYKIIGSES
jgi:hypothetical protein